MKWFKWLFSIMHPKFWAAISLILTGAFFFWWAPGATVSATLGIFLGILWYVLMPILCLWGAWIFCTITEHHWYREVNEYKEIFRSIVDYFSSWWNSRPKPE